MYVCKLTASNGSVDPRKAIIFDAHQFLKQSSRLLMPPCQLGHVESCVPELIFGIHVATSVEKCLYVNNICRYMSEYIYIYIYTHTHTYA